MNPDLSFTENLVREKFAGQEDRSGVPMADHMMRVVSYLDGEDDITLHAAWLHDIVEDTDVSLDDLLDMGYDPRVVSTVQALTHNKKTETYAEYIDRICASGNLRAIKVKLADQRDNKDPKRWLSLNRYVQNALRKRYAGVEQKLLEAACSISTSHS